MGLPGINNSIARLTLADLRPSLPGGQNAASVRTPQQPAFLAQRQQPITIPDKRPPAPLLPTFQINPPGPALPFNSQLTAPLPGGGNAVIRLRPDLPTENLDRPPAANPSDARGTANELRPFQVDATVPLFKSNLGRNAQFNLNGLVRLGSATDSQQLRGGLDAVLKLGGERNNFTLTGGLRQQTPLQSIFNNNSNSNGSTVRSIAELQGTLKLGNFSAGFNAVKESGAGRPATQRFEFPVGLTAGSTRFTLTPSFTDTEGIGKTNQSLTLQGSPAKVDNTRPSFSFGAQIGNNPSAATDSSYFKVFGDYRF